MFWLNWVGLGSGGWGFGLISVSLFGRVDCDWGIGRLWGLVFRCDLNGG